MKKTILLPLLISACLSTDQVLAQDDIQGPAPGRSVVYIARTSILGGAINFTYFDSATLIGRFPGIAYLRYECEPGHHVFWARSENRDFVEAELAPDKTYFLLAYAAMGMVKAKVDLIPVNPAADTKEMERIMKLIKKQGPVRFSEAELAADSKELEPVIDRGLKTYAEEQASGVVHDELPADWCYTVKNF